MDTANIQALWDERAADPQNHHQWRTLSAALAGRVPEMLDEIKCQRAVLDEVRRDRDAERLCRHLAQQERGVAEEALRLIATWTSPSIATPKSVQAAHEAARTALGLSDS